MLLKEEWDQWLDRGSMTQKALKDMLDLFSGDGLDCYQVSKQVNSVGNNSLNLIEKHRNLTE